MVSKATQKNDQNTEKTKHGKGPMKFGMMKEKKTDDHCDLRRSSRKNASVSPMP